MAGYNEIVEADSAARVALLKAIAAKVSSSGVTQLAQLAEAYKNVASTDAARISEDVSATI